MMEMNSRPETINDKSDENYTARKAASMFVHMIARSIWHSTMKRDATPNRFNVSFTMFNGEYIGSIECNNYHQKHSIESLYVFLLGVESIITGKPLFSGHYDMTGQLRSTKQMANGILHQLKNNVRLSATYNSNTGKDVAVITIKPGSYNLETHKGISANNLTIDVEVEEEIKLYVEDNEFMNAASESQ